jgi:branched-chain amino acid transport system substrate-binding protein
MGIATAIDEINGAGGLLGGRPLALEVRDNRSVPARGRDNFIELAQRPEVVAVFCSKYSPVCLEQAPLAERLKTLLLDPWAAADDIVPPRPAGSYVFRLSLKDSWAIAAMVRHLRERGLRRIGVLLPTSAWGRSCEASVAATVAREGGIEVAATEWYAWGVADMRAEYARLRAAGAQAVLLVANEREGALLVNEIAARPPAERLPVVSHWGVTGGRFVQMTGPALKAVDFSVVQTFTLHGRDDARARAVLARAGRLFGVKALDDIPSHSGFGHAYDLTHLLARAIAQAGSTQRSAVRDALERLRPYDGLTRAMARPFTPTEHEALSPAQVFIGRFVDSGAVARARR